MDDRPPQTEEIITTSSTISPQEVVKTTKTVVNPPGMPEPPQKVFQKKKTIFRAYQIIWFILTIIEILLAFRMLLLALGSDPAAGFASLVFALSDPLANPFKGLVGIASTEKSTFDWSIIIAAAVYALLAFGIVQVIHMLKPVSKQEVEQSVDES